MVNGIFLSRRAVCLSHVNERNRVSLNSLFVQTEPSVKRLNFSHNEIVKKQQVMTVQQQQEKVAIYRHELGFQPEPGTLHSNQRLCITTGGRDMYFVNKQQLHKLQIEKPTTPYEFNATKNPIIPFPVHSKFVTESVAYTKSADDRHDFVGVVHDSANDRIACVDTSGHVFLFKLNDHPDKNDNEEQSKRRRLDGNEIAPIFDHQLQSGQQKGELGWNGILFDRSNESKITVARHWHRDVHIVDINAPDTPFVMHTAQRPTSIQYLNIAASHQTLLAVAETNVVNIWDIRTNKCVTSCAKMRGTIYDIKSTESNDGTRFGVTGVDRNVYLYDCKKWTPYSKWNNCIKYAPSWLSFSKRPNICYVAGIDNSEFKAGNYMNSKGNKNSIYADSRWIGFAHYTHYDQKDTEEFIVGIAQSGGLYMLSNPHALVA